MIFVTSGSMLPFDRLFKIVDDAVSRQIITNTVFGQIGEGSYEPKYFKFERFLEKAKYDSMVATSDVMLAHAGIGTIIQALDSGTPLLVLPRRAELGEHVNNHQVTTAEKFESLGHVLSFQESNLAQKLRLLDSFRPVPRQPNVEGVSKRISEFLNTLS